MPPFTPADYAAILLSIKVAVTATLVSLPFGFVAAYILTYGKFRGKLLLEALVNLPLTLPPVVVGYLLLLLLGNKGWLAPVLKACGVQILFTWKAAVIASVIVGFPLLVRSIRIGMEGIEKELLLASRTLGAGRLDTLITIVVPLSTRGVAAGSSLMFSRSLGEFGATIMVAGNIPGITQTIPLAIYDYVGAPGGEQLALSLCLISVTLSLLVLILHEALTHRLTKRI